MFMSPELLAPSNFGLERSKPTREADIYALGLVIYQVYDQDPGCLSFTHMVQVLTGEFPFRSLRTSELAYNVVQGARPSKPENASAIGFSDSLWEFTRRCWDGEMESRPDVGRVVEELEKAAADWAKNVASAASVSHSL